MAKIKFWKDQEQGIIDPALFSKEADDFAREIEKAALKIDREGKPIHGKDGKKQYEKWNRRSQLRKFFDEVIRYNELYQNNNDEWDNILLMIHMLVAKAAYAKGRNLISKEFADFIRDSVRQVNTPKDLELFANFFEAFMGFNRLYGPN
jgi:CRISPR-associated protein Csm2